MKDISDDAENITEDDILSVEMVFVDFFNKINGNIERIFGN